MDKSISANEKQRRELEWDQIIQAWRQQVIETLARIEGNAPVEAVFVTSKPNDAFRMLNWKSWCLRFQVDLEFILRELMTYFRRQRREASPNSRTPVSFGISISTLTGRRSRDIIADAVARRFPNRENVQVRRSELQNKMADITKPMRLAPGNMDHQMQEYKARLDQRHKRLDETRRKFRRRPWRNNPWL